MRDLSNDVASFIQDKWKKVAFQLELEVGEINAIKKDEDNCFDKFMAVMCKWKKSFRKPFSWSTLIIALQSPAVEESDLAEKLRQKYC